MLFFLTSPEMENLTAISNIYAPGCLEQDFQFSSRVPITKLRFVGFIISESPDSSFSLETFQTIFRKIRGIFCILIFMPHLSKIRGGPLTSFLYRHIG